MKVCVYGRRRSGWTPRRTALAEGHAELAVIARGEQLAAIRDMA